MIIEWLKVKVSPELRDQYLQKDAEIWTTALSRYPGFVGKEVWANPEQPSELILIMRWSTREQWKAIPKEDLQQIEQQFADAMGDTYQLVEEAEFYIQSTVSNSK